MAIVTRIGKGIELSHAEMDNNFSELNDRSLSNWSEDSAGNLVPSGDDTLTIGTASKKVKDLFVSTNSLFIGDEHKIAITSAGEVRIAKKVSGVTPAGILADSRVVPGTYPDENYLIAALTAYYPGDPLCDPADASYNPALYHWTEFLTDIGFSDIATPSMYSETDFVDDEGGKGPAGNDGATGSAGPAGPTGPTGPAGNDGATGPAGSDGATGPTGAAGATGPTGAAGNDGATGPAGNDGTTGPAGNDGATGPAGNDGATGPAGNDGATGATGPAGSDGVTGPAGSDGATGPAGSNTMIGLTDTAVSSGTVDVVPWVFDPADSSTSTSSSAWQQALVVGLMTNGSAVWDALLNSMTVRELPPIATTYRANLVVDFVNGAVNFIGNPPGTTGMLWTAIDNGMGSIEISAAGMGNGMSQLSSLHGVMVTYDVMGGFAGPGTAAAVIPAFLNGPFVTFSIADLIAAAPATVGGPSVSCDFSFVVSHY